MAPLTSDDIYSLYQQRKARLSRLHQQALKVRTVAYRELAIPLPEIDEQEAPAVANMLLLGLEQTAMRTASTMPDIFYVPERPNSETSREKARKQRAVNLHWWAEERYVLKMMKRARHLHAYAMSPVIVRPDMREQRPCWDIRDPLTTFPPETQVGNIVPDDCIFAHRHSWDWFRHTYPDIAATLPKPEGLDPQVEILEYIDADQYHTVVCSGTRAVTIHNVPNRTGQPLAVVPGRISLDAPQGQFDGLVGMFQMQAKMLALQIHGMQRAVFPELWLVGGTSGETPQIVSHADPLTGEIGRVVNGSLEQIRIEPSILNQQMVDRLERNMRVEGMIPPEFGGEAATSIRTARRGAQLLSATVDYQIQAAQLIFEQSMIHENKIAAAVDRAYFAGERYACSPVHGYFSYKPTDLWSGKIKNYVRYALPGADVNDLVISGGQRIGIGTMSRRRMMELDPLIEDAEAETDRIVAERLEEAVLTGLQTRAAADPAFLSPLVDIIDDVTTNRKTLVAAYRDQHQRLQQLQQQAAERQLPPEATQPGMANPVPTVGEQPEGLQNLAFLTQSLRSTGPR